MNFFPISLWSSAQAKDAQPLSRPQNVAVSELDTAAASARRCGGIDATSSFPRARTAFLRWYVVALETVVRIEAVQQSILFPLARQRSCRIADTAHPALPQRRRAERCTGVTSAGHVRTGLYSRSVCADCRFAERRRR